MKQSAQVHYRVSVLGRTGRTVKKLARKKNLILDQGLDGIAERTWAQAFSVAVVGTGTTPVRRDSGAVDLSRAGSTVTASAGFFEAADVGRLLKFDSGEEMRVTVFTSATEVTVDTAGTISAGPGTVWYVNQTALAAETKRTNTYSSDIGANGSTFAAATWTHKRTFIFAAEVGSVTYREVGWSHTTAVAANLFGRDLLAGAGVSLVAGQQLKVEVELSVIYSPAASTAWTNVITGWAQDGAHGIVASAVSIVESGGASTTQGGGILEPGDGGTKRIVLSTDSTAIPALISGSELVQAAVVEAISLAAGSYAAGTFAKNYSATFAVGQGNSAALRTIAIGFNSAGQERVCYRVLLNAAETKDSSHTLALTITFNWGRVLTN